MHIFMALRSTVKLWCVFVGALVSVMRDVNFVVYLWILFVIYVIADMSVFIVSPIAKRRNKKRIIVMVERQVECYQPTLKEVESMIRKLRRGVRRANKLLSVVGAEYEVKLLRRKKQDTTP